MLLTAEEAYKAAMLDMEAAILEATKEIGTATSAFEPMFRERLTTLYLQRVGRGELPPILTAAEEEQA